jgi:Rps23 Pro-64 3,4-dihydroxylase Tpa1-like proline 4-hydroxylase
MTRFWFALSATVLLNANFWICDGINGVVDGRSTTRTIKRIKTNNAAEVIVVSNFLPAVIAEAWRDKLLAKWEDMERGDPNPLLSHFLYATNEQNTKIRSLNNINERRSNAWRKRLSGQFAYGKWELNPTDSLFSEISEYMLLNETTTYIADTLGLNPNTEQLSAQELSDLFVTHFTVGDFLSSHSDYYSGTFAFVVSLTAGVTEGEWSQEGYGGGLALLCADDDSKQEAAFPDICHHIEPAFNQLVLFRTRPGPLHSVEAVTAEGYARGFRRLAFTGWYMGVSDTFSEQELKERNAMRGRTKTHTPPFGKKNNKRRRINRNRLEL